MHAEGKTIIFFSLYYPFSFSDSYADEEIKLMAKKFDKIIIVSFDTTSQDRRPTPANSIVYRFSPYTVAKTRLQSLGLLFRGFFYQELYRILFKYKVSLSASVIAELFAFYSRGISAKKFLQRVIEEQKPDPLNLMVYTYWMLEPTFAATLLQKEIPTLKVISRAHSQDVYFFRSPVNYLPFRKFTFDRLSRLFFISTNAKKYFEEKHLLTQEEAAKTVVARIGIPGPGAFIKKDPGSNKLTIISVAFVQPLKRIELIINALALINDITIEWWHLGHSPQSEAYFNEVKNHAAQKFSQAPNISVTFTGMTPKKELYEIYAEHHFDMFLNVSETEGIPVSMMEAMSYSVPCLGTNVGGVAEIIDDNQNGFLVRPDVTAKEIADDLRKYYTLSGEAKNKFRMNAFDTWDQKFNAGKNYRQFTEEVDAL